MQSRSQGFSLIELMVVMLIIGVLAAIAVPSYEAMMQKSRRSDAISTLMKVQLDQERYRANNPQYAGSLSDLGRSDTDSQEGYYTLSITAANANEFTAKAEPKTGTAQEGDSCTFFITQDGPDTSTAAKEECWNS